MGAKTTAGCSSAPKFSFRQPTAQNVYGKLGEERVDAVTRAVEEVATAVQSCREKKPPRISLRASATEWVPSR